MDGGIAVMLNVPLILPTGALNVKGLDDASLGEGKSHNVPSHFNDCFFAHRNCFLL